jgi:hypothetical protein
MIKPIVGSWFEFQHPHPPESVYYNPALAAFTPEQWDQKIKEIAELGMEYLVLMAVAVDFKAYFPTNIFPEPDFFATKNPLEVILTAADKYGVKFFISNDWWGDAFNIEAILTDPEVKKRRFQAMEELVKKFGHHKSFYGWYYPNETGINGHYDDIFMNYVNVSSAEAAKLTPKAKTLIAPYGTRNVIEDKKYVYQLEKLNVDFIAYQDEIGVEKTAIEESGRFFERLYNLHKKAAKSRLWADIEVFKFEGTVYKSALLPASWERVVDQLKAVSPFVEKILIYQYMGMLNRQGTYSFAGHTDSFLLYEGLKNAGYLK